MNTVKTQEWTRTEWTPTRLVTRLGEKVIGQDTAKQKLAGALWWNHYRRQLLAGGLPAQTLPPRQNVLLAGPSGTGKTLLVKAVAELFQTPIFFTSATSYSRVGYVGMNPEDMIAGLVQAAGNDIAQAERGIIFIDEVDKLRKRDFGGQDDVGGDAVQHMLLTFLEGTTAMVKRSGEERCPVNTHGITFIAAGAFSGLDEVVRRRLQGGYDLLDAPGLGEDVFGHVSADDLVDFGLIPEFVARFPVRAGLVPLDREQLMTLLCECAGSPWKQTVQLFKLHGIDLEIDQRAIETLLDLAQGEGTGARALGEMLLDRLFPVINSLPEMVEQGIARVIIDEDTITQRRAPWKIAAEKVQPCVELEQACARGTTEQATREIKPGISDTKGWSESAIKQKLDTVKKKIDWDNTTGSARRWWEAFEKENAHRVALILRLAEELVQRQATVTEFFLAYVYSNTDNIQANLHYLDYTRLKKQEERKKREAAQKPEMKPERFQTGESCPTTGRFQFDGFVDGTGPQPGAQEHQIQLDATQSFPGIPPASKPCWWKKIG